MVFNIKDISKSIIQRINRILTYTFLSIRRITVPSEVVELLKLENGDKLRWIVFNNGMVQLQKV
jgi:hypothetical protein